MQTLSTTTSSMTDDAFARLVADDVKNKVTPNRREVLNKPENWERWKRALLALIENLESQIESLENDSKADMDRYHGMGKAGEKLAVAADRDYLGRINRIRKFLFHVNRRLDQVMSLIEGKEVVVHDEWDTAEIYRRAIREHKKLLTELDMIPTPIDIALWDTLDKLWTLDNIDLNAITD